MAYTAKLDNYIPEVWAKELQRNWDKEFHMKNVVSRDYEGEVKAFGDTLHIQTLGDVTVSDYDNTGTLTYADPDDGTDTLTINQRKSYSFKVGDIDQAQSIIKDVGNKNVARAMVAMNDAVDQYLMSTTVVGDKVDEGIQQILEGTTVPSDWTATTAYSDGDRAKPTSGNLNGFFYEATTAGTSAGSEPTWPTTIGGTVTDGTVVWTNAGRLGYAGGSGAVTATNIYKYFVAAKKMFKEQNTWVDGRMSAIVPPEIVELVETSTELTHATDKGDDVIAMGFSFKLAGFNVLESNNVRGSGTDADPYVCLFLNPDCIVFAEQLVEGPEVLRLEGTFDTAMRGLMVYGAKVTDRMKFAGVRWEVEIG